MEGDVSNLSFGIWDLFVIWDLGFGQINLEEVTTI
jgi:hypothetical protein